MGEQTRDVREDVFGKSYQEVLLFLKHQDDKINRVLTALAFLTTAGVTLYIFSRSDAKSLPDFPTFANVEIAIDDYFFASFIIGVAVSVALSLVSLDPSSFAPRFLAGGGRGERSILFYAAIEERTDSEWEDLSAREDLRELYVRTLHADTRRLARRAVHKVHRFGTANAVVQFTVVALALLGITRLNHVSMSDRWILVTAVLSCYTLTPTIDFAYFWFLHFPDVRVRETQEVVGEGTAPAPPDAEQAVYADATTAGDLQEDAVRRQRLITGIVHFVPFAVVAVAFLLADYREWEAVTYALFGTVLLRLFARIRWRAPWVAVGGATALAVGGMIWLLCS